MENFKSFITEEEEEKDEPYRLIVFNNTGDGIRDVGEEKNSEFELRVKSAKKLGLEIFNIEHTGFFISEKNLCIFSSLNRTLVLTVLKFSLEPIKFTF